MISFTYAIQIILQEQFLTKEQLKIWVDYAKRKIKRFLLFDSAYERYITQKDIPHSIYEIGRSQKRSSIQFRDFSKTAGFTGVRCAYVVIPKELMGILNKEKKFLSMDYGKEEVVANLMEYRILRKEVQGYLYRRRTKRD